MQTSHTGPLLYALHHSHAHACPMHCGKKDWYFHHAVVLEPVGDCLWASRDVLDRTCEGELHGDDLKGSKEKWVFGETPISARRPQSIRRWRGEGGEAGGMNNWDATWAVTVRHCASLCGLPA